jgi:L-asparaginase II
MAAPGASERIGPTPPALADAPVVAQVTRGGVVESVHRASIAVTDAGGELHTAWGNAADPVFPRSAVKPLQAIGMLRAGLTLPPHHLACACASHSGEPFHLDAIRAVLADAGLTEDDLQNIPDLPYGRREREVWHAAGRMPSALAQNCSGKHAAMLATCVANGWPVAAYRDPDHPVQRAIATAIEDLTGETVAATAMDGCGAPLLAVSLEGLARAFGRIAVARDEPHVRVVADAIRAHPEHVGGTGRDVTALISATPGLIAKDGAEGVYAVGLPDGRGVALKIADGAERPRPVVMAAVLRRLGVVSTAFEGMEYAPVLGHGTPVGAVVAAGALATE